MKIALIGSGKTGGKVAEILEEDAIVFNTSNPVTAEKLKECDAAIIFVPGDAADSVIDDVLESRIPSVWGTTGYEWPDDLDQKLKDKEATWIIGSNFSLGMNLIRKAIQLLSDESEKLKDPGFHIHEVHHTHKKDSPSGTALTWKEWLGRDAKITSERKGDIKGIHTLEIRTENELIQLKHKALDRALFAEGAIWSAKHLLSDNPSEPGLYSFSEIFDKQ